MSENGLPADAAQAPSSNSWRAGRPRPASATPLAIGASTALGAALVGGLAFASATADRGYGWVSRLDPVSFACVVSAIGGMTGAALAAGLLRWRIALAALGALAASLAPLSWCDGTVFVAPAFAALLGAALSLAIEKVYYFLPKSR